MKQNKLKKINRHSKKEKHDKQRLKKWKKANKAKDEWIMVSGHEWACAYIRYAYAHFEFAYTCMKHA